MLLLTQMLTRALTCACDAHASVNINASPPSLLRRRSLSHTHRMVAERVAERGKQAAMRPLDP